MIDKYNEMLRQVKKAEEDFIDALEEAFRPIIDAMQPDISVGDEVYYHSKNFYEPGDKMIVIKDYGKTCLAYSLSEMTSFRYDKINLRKTGQHYDAIPIPFPEEDKEFYPGDEVANLIGNEFLNGSELETYIVLYRSTASPECYWVINPNNFEKKIIRHDGFYKTGQHYNSIPIPKGENK